MSEIDEGTPLSEKADIETASADYARRFSGSVGRYFLDVQEKLTLELLAPWAGGTVLDVGGGHAQIALPLLRHGFDVTVTGSDPTCRERLAAEVEAGALRFEICDALDLPFPDHSFDVAVAFRLLPHERHWKRLVAELCRVATHAVVVDYPDARSFNALYGVLFRTKKRFERNTRSFTIFRRQEVRDEFARNGWPAVTLRPQFFAPMVVHRVLRNARLSRVIEAPARWTRLTRLFGSPIVVRACPSK